MLAFFNVSRFLVITELNTIGYTCVVNTIGLAFRFFDYKIRGRFHIKTRVSELVRLRYDVITKNFRTMGAYNKCCPKSV